jgi:hypothetical protein
MYSHSINIFGARSLDIEEKLKLPSYQTQFLPIFNEPGDIIFDVSTKKLNFYDGLTWKELGDSGNVNTLEVITQDLNVLGNASFFGNTTIINSDIVMIEDPLIILGNNELMYTKDSGYLAKYSSNSYAGLVFNNSLKEFQLIANIDHTPNFNNNITSNIEYGNISLHSIIIPTELNDFNILYHGNTIVNINGSQNQSNINIDTNLFDITTSNLNIDTTYFNIESSNINIHSSNVFIDDSLIILGNNPNEYNEDSGYLAKYSNESYAGLIFINQDKTFNLIGNINHNIYSNRIDKSGMLSFIEDFETVSLGIEFTGSDLFDNTSATGVDVVEEGTGIGTSGGFAGRGKHVRYNGTGERHLKTIPLNLSNTENVSFWLIKGISTNGGEQTDTGEDFVLEYSINNGSSYTLIQTILTGSGSSGSIWTEYTINLPELSKTENTILRFRQTSNSGSTFDHYGLDTITINVGGGTGIQYGNLSLHSLIIPNDLNELNIINNNVEILSIQSNIDTYYSNIIINSGNVNSFFNNTGLNVLGNIYSYNIENIENEINIGNLSTLEVSNGNTNVNSDFNFNGDLYQFGNLYISSQWTTENNDIYYETGNVSIGGNINNSKLDVYGDIKIYDINSLSNVSDKLYNLNGDLYWSGIALTLGNSTSSQWTDTTPIGDIYYNGNVGINKIPQYDLDVLGNINFDGSLYQNGNIFISSKWESNENDIYRLIGNVGIGNITPLHNLSVNDNVFVNNKINIKNTYIEESNISIDTNSNDNNGLYFGNPNTNGTFRLIISNSGRFTIQKRVNGTYVVVGDFDVEI